MDHPIQPVNKRMATTNAERIKPVGTTEVQASRLWISVLNVANISTTPLPMRRGHAGGWARTRRFPKKSIKPAIAATQPKIVPTVTSHAEKSAHIMSAVRQYIRSVSSVPTKQAIGMGTSMRCLDHSHPLFRIQSQRLSKRLAAKGVQSWVIARLAFNAPHRRNYWDFLAAF